MIDAPALCGPGIRAAQRGQDVYHACCSTGMTHSVVLWCLLQREQDA